MPGGASAAYRPTADLGRLVGVMIGTEVLDTEPGTTQPTRSGLMVGVTTAGLKPTPEAPGRVRPTRLVAHPNGSYTLDFTWDAKLCAGSKVRIIAKWVTASGAVSYERLEIPAGGSRICPSGPSNLGEGIWGSMALQISSYR